MKRWFRRSKRAIKTALLEQQWLLPLAGTIVGALLALVVMLVLSLPLGSPTMPVAPPARTMGLWPASWKRLRPRSGIRLPTCMLGAVGSKPA